MTPRRLIALLATAALFLLSGCGDTEDDEGAGDETDATEEPTEDTSEDTTDDTSDEADDPGTVDDLEFTAVDIDFQRDEVSAAPGDLMVTLTNEGAIPHTWVVEGHEDELKLEVQQTGDTDQGTITLESGEYTYYCDVPGHRDAGMEGTLTLG